MDFIIYVYGDCFTSIPVISKGTFEAQNCD